MANKFLDSNGLLYLWQKIKNQFVPQERGKGLSTNDYTTEDKNKLAGLSNYTLPPASSETLGGVKVGAGLVINEGVLSATGGGTADSVEWANVQNKPTIPDSADDVGAVATTSVGQPNGVASLDANGIIPSSQLPSFVDDVIEGYYYDEAFYKDSGHTTVITGEASKIYVDLDTNLSYRYGGSTYVQITSSDMAAITNAEIDTIIAS